MNDCGIFIARVTSRNYGEVAIEYFHSIQQAFFFQCLLCTKLILVSGDKNMADGFKKLTLHWGAGYLN